MRPPIFFFVAFFIQQAACFGLYGSYERIMFWNAYQLDANSPKPKIAKACASDPSVQKAQLGKLINGRCNFRQFLHYISGTDSEKSKIKGLPENIGDSKNINKIANALHDADVSGVYKPQLIWEGTSRHNVPYLFEAVGILVGLDRNKDTPQRQWAIEARARVEEGRTASRNRNVGNLLRWEYDRKNQGFDPYRPEAPRDPPMNTNGDFPEKKSHSAGSNNARGWPTVDLEQAQTTYVENENRDKNERAKQRIHLARIEEKKQVQDFNIEEWIKKSDDLEVPRKNGESDEDWSARKKEAEKTGHKANIEKITKARKSMLQCGR